MRSCPATPLLPAAAPRCALLSSRATLGVPCMPRQAAPCTFPPPCRRRRRRKKATLGSLLVPHPLWKALPPAAAAAVADVAPLLEPALVPRVGGWGSAVCRPLLLHAVLLSRAGSKLSCAAQRQRAPTSLVPSGCSLADCVAAWIQTTPRPQLAPGAACARPCAQVPDHVATTQLLFTPAEDQLLAVGIKK